MQSMHKKGTFYLQEHFRNQKSRLTVRICSPAWNKDKGLRYRILGIRWVCDLRFAHPVANPDRREGALEAVQGEHRQAASNDRIDGKRFESLS